MVIKQFIHRFNVFMRPIPFFILVIFGSIPASAVPLRGLDLQTTEIVKIPILAYHYVSPGDPPIDPNNASYAEYFVTPEQFESQLDVLLAHGYETIGLDDWVNYRNGLPNTQLPSKPVIITFDDGQQGIYDYAYPALKARDMTATFFVITDYTKDTDAERCVDQNWAGVPSCQLIWPEIVEMHAGGFEIGSHTRSHPNLKYLYGTSDGPAKVADQINGSKQAIESYLGEGSVEFFAYPHGLGSETQGIVDLLVAGGYRAAVAYTNVIDFDRLSDPLTDGLYAIPRRAVDRAHTMILDVDNPWSFFITRVDPNFALPSIGFYPSSGLRAFDAVGRKRIRFFPGEELALDVKAENWDQPADVTVRLKIANSNGISYDSHLTNPTTDQSALPMPNGGWTFKYAWEIPASAEALGTYPYQLLFTDPSGLLEYYRYEPASGAVPAFEVVPNPITLTAAPAKLPVWVGQIKPLVFHISVAEGQSIGKAYLVVSVSEHLDIVGSKSDQGNWTRYEIGSLLKNKSGQSVSSEYLVYELYDPNYGTASQTYELQIQALPGITANDWVKYRLSMETIQPKDNPTGESFLREPLLGMPVDQQSYSAHQIDGSDPPRIYLPFIEK